jgi:hypothetical protein
LRGFAPMLSLPELTEAGREGRGGGSRRCRENLRRYVAERLERSPEGRTA